MSKQQTELTRAISEGGIAATHALIKEQSVLVGPATANEHNTIKAGIIPIACWRVEDFRFAFDSSVVAPEIKRELELLAQLVKQHPPLSKAEKLQPPQLGCPLSVFGHADPIGNDDYNKQLSGRRAKAIYGLLTRRTELWEELFSQPFGNDKWGRKSLETMLDTVSPESAGKSNQEQAVQHERNAGKRKELFALYMEKLCGPELKLEKKDFLGQGDDAGGKGDFQGCSEFNPVLIFSRKDQTKFEQDKDKTERNEENASNRRVMVLIFRKGSRVDPFKWPCPRVKEGVAGCRKRFWSDGEKRRTRRLPDDPRIFEKTEDTFACRFYQRMITGSPCERVVGRALWITEIPEGLEDEIFLVIRATGGKEVARLKPDQAAAGPADNRTFDLSQLDPDIPVLLELHAGERFIAPIVNLAINALRVSLAASNNQAVGASLFVAEGRAGPSDPFDDVSDIDPSGEPQFPVDEDDRGSVT